MNTAVVRRLTWLLFFGQSLGSAAFIAGATVGAIVGEHLSGQPALAGLPSASYLLGSALAAYPAARLMERFGRRAGLSLGFVMGITGALVCGFAVLGSSFGGFLLGMTAMGVTRGFTDLGRYAAAEMHPATQRARAISLVVLGGTVGAILGPALVAPMGRLAVNFDADALAGPWFAAAGLFVLGLALIGLFLRPDPSDLARQFAAEELAGLGAPAAPARPWRDILAQSSTRVAIAAMIIGQLVMVMLMTITSLHMTHHGHPLGDVSIVIMAHTLGMFGLSVVTGRLADNFGRAPVIVAGGALLIAACVLAPLSQRTDVLALALFLLGLGWNFCAVAGAALLTDSLSLAERGRLQGTNDLAVGLVSALGSLQSGALFAVIGYANLSWISLVVSLIPALLAARLIFLASRQARRDMRYSA
jgi:MFS family permease